MKDAVLALVAGFVVGAVFKMIKLPLPAPPILAGVLGVAGVYLGGKFIETIVLKLSS
ncbi:XapX domain-containing protein [Alkalihalobacillus sp. AL-G]|nr:XapX domain-containing protein [Alkalihalobacillus sp. AL-G]WLD95305.1 XapX domain-containing protein [Alkalihalobacillus sp. AL-G]